MRTLRAKLGSDFHVVLGGLTLALIAGAVALVGSGQFGNLARGGGRTVEVVFPNTQQVRSTGFMHNPSEVRIDGVDVGHVSDVRLDPGARSATVKLTLEDSAGPIYRDARASLRWQSLLGANFYIAIDRGSPSAGPLGANAIPPNRTSNQVELEDVTSVFRDGARSGVRQMPKELTAALDDPRALRRALSTATRIAPAAATALRSVRGQEPATDLPELVSSTRSALRALDAPNHDLRRVVAGAAATLGTVGDNRVWLQRTIAQAPGALGSTRVTLRRLDGTLALLDPLISKLDRAAPHVAPTLAALHPTVVDADKLLQDAVPLLRALRPTARSLAAMAKQGVPLLRRLTPSLDEIDQKILPYLNEVHPSTKHTTAEMIGPAIAVYANSGGLVDTHGRSIRFPLSFGSSSAYLPCQTYFNNPDAARQIACQTLREALESVLTYKPPPPKGPGGRKR